MDFNKSTQSVSKDGEKGIKPASQNEDSQIGEILHVHVTKEQESRVLRKIDYL